MDLFEVAAEGYHTPLTSEEIAELFHAGRLGREDPCKPIGDTKWRTIDELFPLLKYDSVSQLLPYHVRERSVIPWIAMAAVVILGTTVAAIYSWSNDKSAGLANGVQLLSSERQHERHTSEPPATVFATPAMNRDRLDPIQKRRQNAELELAKAEHQRLAREQLQREQAALADKLRAQNQQDEKLNQRAAGRDVIVPRGKFETVSDVGGVPVSVKIIDNNVTSFDVWINGEHRREVRKQKGITGSRTDETLLYRNSRASLYYVWEISGKLNSCLLRIREG